MSGSLFKDLQAEFRENKKKDAEIYTADIHDKIQEKRIEYELLMKNIDDKHTLALNGYYNESNLRVDAYTCENEKEQHKMREEQAEINNKHNLEVKDIEASTNLKISGDNNERTKKQMDYMVKKVDLESKKWDAQF